MWMRCGSCRAMWMARSQALGFARERQAFRPHLTLARLHNRASAADRRRAIAALVQLSHCRKMSAFAQMGLV